MILFYVVLLIFLALIARAIVLTGAVCKEIKDDVFIEKGVDNESRK